MALDDVLVDARDGEHPDVIRSRRTFLGYAVVAVMLIVSVETVVLGWFAHGYTGRGEQINKLERQVGNMTAALAALSKQITDAGLKPVIVNVPDGRPTTVVVTPTSPPATTAQRPATTFSSPPRATNSTSTTTPTTETTTSTTVPCRRRAGPVCIG